MFRVRENSRMDKWFEKFAYRKITDSFDDRFLCELHFNRLDLLRIRPWDQMPLKHPIMADRKVVPVYFNQRSVQKWNTIAELKDLREHYKRCLNLYNWKVDMGHLKCTLQCTINSNSLVIRYSLVVYIFDGDERIKSKKMENAFLIGGKIKSWSKLRGLMRYCERHERLPRNATVQTNSIE